MTSFLANAFSPTAVIPWSVPPYPSKSSPRMVIRSGYRGLLISSTRSHMKSFVVLIPSYFLCSSRLATLPNASANSIVPQSQLLNRANILVDLRYYGEDWYCALDDLPDRFHHQYLVPCTYLVKRFGSFIYDDHYKLSPASTIITAQFCHDHPAILPPQNRAH